MAIATPVLERTTQKLVDALAAAGGPPIYTLSPTDAREVLTRLQATEVTKLPAEIEDVALPVGPTGSTRVRIVRPPGAEGAYPELFARRLNEPRRPPSHETEAQPR